MGENFNIKQQTVYDCSFDTSIDNFDNIAIEYYGNKISYLDMFVKVDEVCKSLAKRGIRRGDVVSICTPSIPEALYIFLALNKMGAVAHLIDPTMDADKIEDYLNDTNSKMIFYLDVLYPKLVNIFDHSQIDNFVSISLSNSFPPIIKAICDLKEGIESLTKQKAICDKEITSWDNFIKNGTDYQEEPMENLNRLDLDSVIIYDEGKRITLTNYDLLLKVNNNRLSKDKWNIKDTFLGIMPISMPFSFDGYILSLCNGLKIDLEPTATVNKLDEYVLRHKPNHIMCNKLFLNYFIKSKRLHNKDLDFIKTFVLSDSVPPINEEIINLLLLKHHSCARVSNDTNSVPIINEKLEESKVYKK